MLSVIAPAGGSTEARVSGMVGVMAAAAGWGERAATLLDSAKSSGELPSKLERLRRLKEVILNRDPSLLPEFVPRIVELQADPASPVRRFLAELIGEIGLKNVELLPDLIPSLMLLLQDETPAVARQSITSGTYLFRVVLEKIVFQGLCSGEIDDSLKSSWAWMLKLKNAVCPIAVQPGTEGVRLLAVKFIEALILLYTPDPELSSDPAHEAGLGFNISWLKGGHPLFNVGDLAMEASQNLRLLLDQLKFPQVKSLSNSMIMVLVNSLSAIATRRPSFYGRILPVLLCLDPACSVIKGVQVPGAYHALKNAFVACLKCTHSSAAPWRVRLVEAVKAMNAGDLGERALGPEISGSMAHNPQESPLIKEDKFSIQVNDETQTDVGRKRYIVHENSNFAQDDGIAGKRIRPSLEVFQETAEEPLQTGLESPESKLPVVDSMPPARDGPSGPVQQLVDMFGALAAQGDKASGSLEILTSSISSDLLAEVVMANMRHLPSFWPKAEIKEESPPDINLDSISAGNNFPATQPSALVSEIVSLSSVFPLIASLLKPSISHDSQEIHKRNAEKIVTKEDKVLMPSLAADAFATVSTVPESVASFAPYPHVTEMSNSTAPPYEDDVQAVESKIPGLGSTSAFDEIQEPVDASPTSLDELQGRVQEQAKNLDGTLALDVSSSSCTEILSAETLSPRTTVSDAKQESSTTSFVVSTPYLLPKMAILDANLTDEEKDNLQKAAFARILEAYKQVALSGGSHVHMSLLAHLGIEFSLDLDPWALLQKHVLSDYVNNEGHELTLRVLYRLYRETEQDQDFLSSRTATSVYEAFLLTVAETLRDMFPASDKSLGRLLGEVPYLSEGVLKLLECLCSPEKKEQSNKDFQSSDRVTQGLSTVWSLILLRPSSRDRCLQIALQSTVHHLEEVRMKAIRLVANKLFPMPSISRKIEDFATEKLCSVVEDGSTMELMDVGATTPALQKDGDLEKPLSGGQTPSSLATNESDSESVSEAQRCTSLYFALCTKKHSLLRQIFVIYKSITPGAKQAVHRHLPILIRTIGSSPDLLTIISDLPSGSESLLLQVLQTLTDGGAVPSQDLMSTMTKLYYSKLKDVGILIPILSFLSKDEVMPIFPQLINLPMEKFQSALARLLQGSPQTGPSLTPAEVLISIHTIDSERDGIPLKKVMDACSACFEQRQVFTQQVLAKVLNQLVEQIPLPLLFMRTVIQAIGVFPPLVDFVMEILSRLVSKQIWRYPKLWVGFLKCAVQTKPQSFNVLLQLPAAQLENALSKNPVLKPPLVEHANQPEIRSTLPRSTLVVLGLANDSQTSGQQQTSQSQAPDTGSSAADVATEVTQESSGVS